MCPNLLTASNQLLLHEAFQPIHQKSLQMR
jgi:hypothetical protein